MNPYEYTLEELVAKQAEINAAVEERKASDRASAIADIQAKIALFGIEQAEVFAPPAKKARRARKPLPAKYFNPETNEAWTGKGRPPAWLKDLSADERAKYLVS